MKALGKDFFSNGCVKTLSPHKFSTAELEPDSFAFVATLTADERDLMEGQWIAYRTARKTVQGGRAFMLTYCLCDENNQRFFNAGEDQEKLSSEFVSAVERIGKYPAPAVHRGFTLLCSVNGLSENEVEELEGN